MFNKILALFCNKKDEPDEDRDIEVEIEIDGDIMKVRW